MRFKKTKIRIVKVSREKKPKTNVARYQFGASAIADVRSCKDPSPPVGALLPDKEHLVLLLVVYLQLR